MLRWRWVLVLWVIGGAMTAYGVWVELEVRSTIGTGAKRFMARIFYDNAIEEYRWFSTLCCVVGPLVILGAFLLRRNWDRIREGRWLQGQAERLFGKAEWWRKQSTRLKGVDPAAAQAAQRKADQLARKSQRLSEKALRKLREAGDGSA